MKTADAEIIRQLNRIYDAQAGAVGGAPAFAAITGAPEDNAALDAALDAKGPAPSDAAYDATAWNGVGDVAPSKNTARDKFVLVDAAVATAQSTADIKQTEAQVQALIDATPGVRKSVAATAHGFVVGDVLRMDGTAYVKAQSDNDTNAEAIGMVASVTDANNFVLATGGFISGLSGLTAGATYFLSPTTAGAITATEPTTDGQISKPVFIATTTTAGYFFNMRGSEVGGSSSSGVIGTAYFDPSGAGIGSPTYAGIVSGVAYDGTGLYTVSFSAPQADAKYGISVDLPFIVADSPLFVGWSARGINSFTIAVTQSSPAGGGAAGVPVAYDPAFPITITITRF